MSNLTVFFYLAAIWAFGTHVGSVATPWTIGWLIAWLVFSPIACWTGVFVLGSALRLAQFSILALIVAAPFSPDALTTLLTLVVSWTLGAVAWLWVPIAVFVGIVAAIYVGYTGGLGL